MMKVGVGHRIIRLTFYYYFNWLVGWLVGIILFRAFGGVCNLPEFSPPK